MKNPNNIEYRYLTRHWNKPLAQLNGNEMLKDILAVFNYNEQYSKYIIRQWFSKCYILDDKWFESNNDVVCDEDGGACNDEGFGPDEGDDN
jgi:hypothetical protein